MEKQETKNDFKFKLGTIVQVKGVPYCDHSHSKEYLDGLGVIINQNDKDEYLIFFGNTADWINKNNSIEKFREQDVDEVHLARVTYHVDPKTGKYVNDLEWLMLCITINDFEEMTGLDPTKTVIRFADDKETAFMDSLREKILNGKELQFDEE